MKPMDETVMTQATTMRVDYSRSRVMVPLASRCYSLREHCSFRKFPVYRRELRGARGDRYCGDEDFVAIVETWIYKATRFQRFVGADSFACMSRSGTHAN